MAQLRRIYLALGSNVGDRAAHLDAALHALKRNGVRVLRRSSLYLTEPAGFAPQRWFLNCAVEAETELLPGQLLGAIRRAEQSVGRRRYARLAPRVVDMDVLFYGRAQVRRKELEIPHPRLLARRFVLAPLLEIAPRMCHPALQSHIREWLARCPDNGVVRRLARGDS